MNELSISLENCFGISKFNHTFRFTDKNCVLIYAPNGMMKSSFAKTFECISKNDSTKFPVKDRIYSSRKSECRILCDGTDIVPSTIFVANAETELDTNSRITAFLASKELKERYESIYAELSAIKMDFLAKLKTTSRSSDCESEIISTFSSGEDESIFTCLLAIENEIKKPHIKYDFKYNDVFDKKSNVRKFLEKHKDLISQYFAEYKELLGKSTFFNANEDGTSFGTYQASILRESVADQAFFSAHHLIKLSSGVEITSTEQLQSIIDNEIKAVVSDERLKATFDKIDKAIGNNSELRAFKAVIEKDNTIIPLLADYDAFKRQVWFGYLCEISELTIAVINTYKEKLATLTELVAAAQKESQLWESIISIYNKKFAVPFSVEIKNKSDVILKQDAATLVFKYKDNEGEAVEQPKDDLLQVLSRGERRAFYILQLLFEIEARKCSPDESLIILDDIADSFDYKNKYAIVEYLVDILKNTKFKIILLTHNFDFYRTVCSRLGLGNTVYMAMHDMHGGIMLKSGQYRKDVFKHFVRNINERRVFIGLIPFARNIIEYTKGEESNEYIQLTNCLHQKTHSNNIIAQNIYDIYTAHIHGCVKPIDFGNTKIIELILTEAETIASENPLIDDILLENKLVLSIAIRLLAERLLLKIMPDVDTDSIESVQTRVLIDKYNTLYQADDYKISKLLDRVSLMTPENIHLNTFMYEPLIDMSVRHLIVLYTDVKNALDALP